MKYKAYLQEKKETKMNGSVLIWAFAFQAIVRMYETLFFRI
jgi:hypothetical protein